MKTKMFRQTLGFFTLTLLGAWSAYGQAANPITNVSPAAAAQGPANLLVNFTNFSTGTITKRWWIFGDPYL